MQIHHKKHKSHKTNFFDFAQSPQALVVSERSALFVFLCLLWPFPVKIPLPNFANASDINILLIIPFVDNSF